MVASETSTCMGLEASCIGMHLPQDTTVPVSMFHGMPFLLVKGGCKPSRTVQQILSEPCMGGFCSQWERGQLGKGPSCKGSWFCQSLNAPRACVVCLPSPPGCNFRLDSPTARFEFASTRGLVGWIALSVQKAGGCSFVDSAQRRSFLYRCAGLKGGCRRLDGCLPFLLGRSIACNQRPWALVDAWENWATTSGLA